MAALQVLLLSGDAVNWHQTEGTSETEGIIKQLLTTPRPTPAPAAPAAPAPAPKAKPQLVPSAQRGAAVPHHGAELVDDPCLGCSSWGSAMRHAGSWGVVGG